MPTSRSRPGRKRRQALVRKGRRVRLKVKSPVAQERAARLLEKNLLERARTDERNRHFLAVTTGKISVTEAVQRTRATQRARAEQLAAALRRVRLSGRDRGKLVIFSTAGKRYRDLVRVPSGIKVYVVRVDRRGRRRWFNPIDPNTVARGVRGQLLPQTLRDFNWRKYQRSAPKKFHALMGELWRQVGESPYHGATFSEKLPRGELDPFLTRAALVFQKAVRAQADQTHWVIDYVFHLPGMRRAVRGNTDPLKSEQFLELELGTRRLRPRNRRSLAQLRAITAYKVRDSIRGQLAHLGLVTPGSTRRIRRLAANEGKRRTQWVDRLGRPWKGRKWKTARPINLTWRLRRVF